MLKLSTLMAWRKKISVCWQVEAMELRSLAPDLPTLLAEMGVTYDPERLAQALQGREVEIAARAVKVATMLGGCIAAVAKVGIYVCKVDLHAHKRGS